MNKGRKGPWSMSHSLYYQSFFLSFIRSFIHLSLPPSPPNTNTITHHPSPFCLPFPFFVTSREPFVRLPPLPSSPPQSSSARFAPSLPLLLLLFFFFFLLSIRAPPLSPSVSRSLSVCLSLSHTHNPRQKPNTLLSSPVRLLVSLVHFCFLFHPSSSSSSNSPSRGLNWRRRADLASLPSCLCSLCSLRSLFLISVFSSFRQTTSLQQQQFVAVPRPPCPTLSNPHCDRDEEPQPPPPSPTFWPGPPFPYSFLHHRSFVDSLFSFFLLLLFCSSSSSFLISTTCRALSNLICFHYQPQPWYKQFHVLASFPAHTTSFFSLSPPTPWHRSNPSTPQPGLTSFFVQTLFTAQPPRKKWTINHSLNAMVTPIRSHRLQRTSSSATRSHPHPPQTQPRPKPSTRPYLRPLFGRNIRAPSRRPALSLATRRHWILSLISER